MTAAHSAGWLRTGPFLKKAIGDLQGFVTTLQRHQVQVENQRDSCLVAVKGEQEEYSLGEGKLLADIKNICIVDIKE